MFRCLFFKRLVFHENEPSSFIFIYFLYIYIFFFVHWIEDLLHYTLKLSAVLLAPAGTVYRLLGNQGSRHEKQGIPCGGFGCHISLSRRVRIARRFGSKYLTTSFSAEWGTGRNPLWGQTS